MLFWLSAFPENPAYKTSFNGELDEWTKTQINCLRSSIMDLSAESTATILFLTQKAWHHTAHKEEIRELFDHYEKTGGSPCSGDGFVDISRLTLWLFVSQRRDRSSTRCSMISGRQWWSKRFQNVNDISTGLTRWGCQSTTYRHNSNMPVTECVVHALPAVGIFKILKNLKFQNFEKSKFSFFRKDDSPPEKTQAELREVFDS